MRKNKKYLIKFILGFTIGISAFFMVIRIINNNPKGQI